MKRYLKYGLYVLGAIALVYMAFMLPILLSRIPGTWAFFTARAESSPITITTGFWDDESIPDEEDEKDDIQKEKDKPKDKPLDDPGNGQDAEQDANQESQIEIPAALPEDSTIDANVAVPDQTTVTDVQAPVQTTVTVEEGNNNAESTITAE